MINSLKNKFSNIRRAAPCFLRAKFYRKYPDERKRIFVIVNSLGGGGAQRVATIVASGLSEKYNVTLVIGKKREVEYPVSDKVEVLRIPIENLTRDSMIQYMKILKRVRKPAACISFMFDGNRLNLSAEGPGKVICSERNNPVKKNPQRFPETVAQYEKADHVIFQSTTVRNLYEEDIRARSTVLPNPVNISCEADGVSREKIVTVGRLHEQKNQAMLIRAFAGFLKDHPGYELSLYGDGELREDLEKLARDLEIAGSVVFHGTVKDIPAHIKDARMFVLSSDYEGLSNALLEAMMMGLPCISTACEGSTDVIQSGENGILIPVGDEDALECAMRRLADDDAFRKQLAAAGKRTGEAFSSENVIAQWEKMIESVL
ncbi:MAG: glycosyltransferase [Bacillota bacterium]|nr:glycosyltransferase [Bacillota bacterium]